MPTTHVGSLPRTGGSVARGRDGTSAGGFELAAEVERLVLRQLEAGITVVNDGEAGKPSFSTYVSDRLTGIEPVLASALPVPSGPAFREELEFPDVMQALYERWADHAPAEPRAVVGPVSYVGQAALQADIEHLLTASRAAGAPAAFMTAASPGIVAHEFPDLHYEDHEALVWAVGDAMKEEYDAIVGSGLLLQLDCPDIAGTRWSLDDWERMHRVHLDALDHATHDIPPERMRMHICWGNYNGPHNHDVPLEAVIDRVLAARPAQLSFEAANPRHEHEWRVFAERPLPDGTVLLPGVVDTTTNYLEHPQVVADRIERYAGLVGRDNVIASTDCGFATLATLPSVDPQVAWAKLAVLAEGAEIATRSLWPG